MHYSFDLKTDKIDSLSNDGFNEAEKDWILNYAIDVFVKQRYGVTNNKQLGLETTQKRIDDLKSLHKKEYEITTTLYKPNLYEANLSQITKPNTSTITDDYWFCTRLRADIKKGSCIKNTGVSTVQTDDLNTALLYKLYSPNFNWGKVLATFNLSSDATDSSIFLYTKDFEVLKLYIDYIKKPNRVWIGTYDSLDGSLTTGVDAPINCDLPDSTHEEITTLASSLAMGVISDPNFIQMKQQYFEGE